MWGRSLVQFLAAGAQGTFEWLLGWVARVRAEAQALHADGTVLDVLLNLTAPAPGRTVTRLSS